MRSDAIAKDRITERQRKRVQTRWMIQLEKSGWEMTPEQFDEMYVGFFRGDFEWYRIHGFDEAPLMGTGQTSRAE